MRRMRWLVWLANFLVLLMLVATGAHSHHGGPTQDRGCIACTLAHSPIATPGIAPAPRAPEPTREIAIEIPVLVATPPLCSIPSPRAPPLG